MKKLSFTPRTLDELIVKDGLVAVSTLNNYSESKDLWFIVGGMATQSYLPSSCRRPSSDIDLAVLKPLNYSDFKDFSKGVSEYLQDNKYSVEQRKGHNSFIILYSKDEEVCAIEFARRNEANFARIENRLNYEAEHTRKKLVEGTIHTLKVASPEDIAIPKLVRSVNTLSRNKELSCYLNNNNQMPLSDAEIKKQLTDIAFLREEAALKIGDPRISSILRFVSDLYDVRILSEITGFNESDFKLSASRWDSFAKKPAETKSLFAYALPKLELSQ